MNNYFASEIQRLEKELLYLKTHHNLFGGQVPMIVKSLDVTIPLFNGFGDAYYKIITSSKAFFDATLNICNEDIYSDSPITLPYLEIWADGSYVVHITAEAFPTTLDRCSRELSVVCTEEFEIERLEK